MNWNNFSHYSPLSLQLHGKKVCFYTELVIQLESGTLCVHFTQSLLIWSHICLLQSLCFTQSTRQRCRGTYSDSPHRMSLISSKSRAQNESKCLFQAEELCQKEHWEQTMLRRKLALKTGQEYYWVNKKSKLRGLEEREEGICALTCPSLWGLYICRHLDHSRPPLKVNCKTFPWCTDAGSGSA